MRRFVLLAALAATTSAGALAQVPMPNLREMSGTPLPTSDLPDGAISVRVVRGALSNNIPNQAVEMHADRLLRTANTDDNGRALFTGLPPGTTVHAVTTVGGERLESKPFEVPARGGIRLMLVAGADAPPSAGQPALPAQPGTVVLGSESRFVIEIEDEALQVYCLLDIVNTSRAPVTAGPLLFEMPTGAQGTTVLEGSSPQASANGPRVTVTGPFQPGRTSVQLPTSSGSEAFELKMPAALQQVSVIVEKLGDLHFGSPQIASHRDVAMEGRSYIIGTGGAVPQGGTVRFELDGLPHHSRVPRYVALALATMILLAGAWAATARPETEGAEARRRKLAARRERLLKDLARVERQRATGEMADARYAARRQELVAQLEHIYAELEEQGPEGTPGVSRTPPSAAQAFRPALARAEGSPKGQP
jgi:hypothetical protein